jgi:hypothetical protein
MLSAKKSTGSKSRVPLRPLSPTRVTLKRKVESLQFDNKVLTKELTLTKEFALNLE